MTPNSFRVEYALDGELNNRILGVKIIRETPNVAMILYKQSNKSKKQADKKNNNNNKDIHDKKDYFRRYTHLRFLK